MVFREARRDAVVVVDAAFRTGTNCNTSKKREE
jgi:hypothetical protein